MSQVHIDTDRFGRKLSVRPTNPFIAPALVSGCFGVGSAAYRSS